MACGNSHLPDDRNKLPFTYHNIRMMFSKGNIFHEYYSGLEMFPIFAVPAPVATDKQTHLPYSLKA